MQDADFDRVLRPGGNCRGKAERQSRRGGKQVAGERSLGDRAEGCMHRDVLLFDGQRAAGGPFAPAESQAPCQAAERRKPPRKQDDPGGFLRSRAGACGPLPPKQADAQTLGRATRIRANPLRKSFASWNDFSAPVLPGWNVRNRTIRADLAAHSRQLPKMTCAIGTTTRRSNGLRHGARTCRAGQTNVIVFGDNGPSEALAIRRNQRRF